MNKSKEYLIGEITRRRKIHFYNSIVKMSFITVFVALCPLLIYKSVIQKDLLISFFLLMSEVVFVVILIFLFRFVKDKINVRESRIIKCIENPEILSEFIVNNYSFLFEIKGMENETLIISHNETRKKILIALKDVFDSSKIVTNV